jgi:hypothetical protein
VKQLGHLLEGCSLAAVILIGLALFGAIHAFTSFMSGLPWFASEAQKVQFHLQAVQEQQQAALAAPWMPLKVAAESVAWITLCLSFAVFLVMLLAAFVAHRVRAAAFVWAKGGVLPVPRRVVLQERRMVDAETVTVGEKELASYWKVEDDNATRQLPPVTQHVHELKVPAGGAPEIHHEMFDEYAGAQAGGQPEEGNGG